MKVQKLIEEDALFVIDGKNEFLSSLRDTFHKCISEGVTQFIQYHAVCRLCFSKTRVVGFKDAAGKGRLGLYFQPMISNTSFIHICTRFTTPDNIYNKEVHFAPDNLTKKEWHDHAQIIDTGVIPEHMKKPKSVQE